MKKILILATVLLSLCLSACSSNEPPLELEVSFAPRTSFENNLLEFATDVAVVQYVGKKSFGKETVEYEFIVLESVFNCEAERIYVYADKPGSPYAEAFKRGNLSFNTKTRYLLPLKKLPYTFTDTKEDGYWFLFDIVIDLDDASKSAMYGDREPLNLHSEGFDFSKNTSEESIKAYVKEVMKDKKTGDKRVRIKAEKIEDVIAESPYVFVVNPMAL